MVTELISAKRYREAQATQALALGFIIVSIAGGGLLGGLMIGTGGYSPGIIILLFAFSVIMLSIAIYVQEGRVISLYEDRQ